MSGISYVAGVLSAPFAVAIGLPFKVLHKGRETTFSQYKHPTSAKAHIDLPEWLKWYQNAEDGLMGDDRGWYWNEYCKSWWPTWFRMWWWSGIRNPANYLKRNILGVDVREYVITKVAGDDYVRDDLDSTGCQILKAEHVHSDKVKYALYWVWLWPFSSTRAIVVQLGPKVKLEHNGVMYADEWDYLKGVTFEVNPVKDIS